MVLGVEPYYGTTTYASSWSPPAYDQFRQSLTNASLTQSEPPAPSFTSATSNPDDLISQMKFLMTLASLGGSGGGSTALNYDIYSPQEVAQRGLAMSGATGGALDAQTNYINAQRGYLGEQAGYISRQEQANALKNQLAGQDIGAQRDANMLNAEQQRHAAKGQFAANGSIVSDAASQALGGGDGGWRDFSRTPWRPDAKGDITRQRDLTNQSLYRQLLGINSDYGVAQAGLYNQLYGLNVQGTGLDTQQAQLAPQYLENSQITETLNRLLNGQYNTNVTPENAALMSALSQALYRTKVL